jgi:hypothetical protein
MAASRLQHRYVPRTSHHPQPNTLPNLGLLVQHIVSLRTGTAQLSSIGQRRRMLAEKVVMEEPAVLPGGSSMHGHILSCAGALDGHPHRHEPHHLPAQQRHVCD